MTWVWIKDDLAAIVDVRHARYAARRNSLRGSQKLIAFIVGLRIRIRSTTKDASADGLTRSPSECRSAW